MRITQCKFKRFQQFAQSWLNAHVTAEQQNQCNEWLLGNNNINTPNNNNNAWSMSPKTKVILQNELKKTPYRPYQRYKVLSAMGMGMGGTGGAGVGCGGGIGNITANTTTSTSMGNVGAGGSTNIITSSYNNSTNAITSSITTMSTSPPTAAGVNLTTLANVTALNVAAVNNKDISAAVGGGSTLTTSSAMPILVSTQNFNNVDGGLMQSSAVNQEPAPQVRPLES